MIHGLRVHTVSENIFGDVHTHIKEFDYSSKEEFMMRVKEDIKEALKKEGIFDGMIHAVLDGDPESLFYFNRTISTKDRSHIVYLSPLHTPDKRG